MEQEIASLWVDQKLSLPEIVSYVQEKFGADSDERIILRALAVELQTQIIHCNAVLNMPAAEMQPYLEQLLRMPVTTSDIDDAIVEFHANVIFFGIHRRLPLKAVAEEIQDMFGVLVDESFIEEMLQAYRQEYELMLLRKAIASDWELSGQNEASTLENQGPTPTSMRVAPLSIRKKALD